MRLVNPSDTVFQELFRGICAVHARGVHGDIAEFGTMTGRTASLLASSLTFVDKTGFARHAFDTRPRELHLFDSFEGLPSPGEGDIDSPAVQAGQWGHGTHKGLSAQQLEDQCATVLGRQRIKIFAGWFSDTIPTIPAATRYAMVHVDGDLYSSALDVLDGLFSRGMVAEGAEIFFDDWNCNFASPRFGERRAWRECVEKYAIEFSDGGDYGVVSHRMTVHAYRPPVTPV